MFQVLLSNINSLIELQLFVCIQLNSQTVRSKPLMGRYQVLQIRVRLDQGAMAMKVYSIFPKAPKIEIHH